MLLDKIIYINLERRPDRNKNVIDQLTKLNLIQMAERFNAIDGSTLNLDKIDSSIITKQGIDDAKKSEIIYKFLTPGAIGCAMSHRAIYQKIINENIQRCLILEDDITIDENFNEKIKDIENEISYDYDLFFLGYHINASLKGNIYWQSDNTKKFSQIYGLFSYIVTQEGAKKLLDLFPISLQIDSVISENSDKINICGMDWNKCKTSYFNHLG